MLTKQQILQRLNIVRYSPRNERYGGHIQSISSIAEQAGLTRAALYEMMRTGRMQLRSQALLSDAVQCCQTRRGARSNPLYPTE
jgi:hypothetical protein